MVAYQPKAFWLTDYQPNICGSVGSVGEGLRKLSLFVIPWQGNQSSDCVSTVLSIWKMHLDVRGGGYSIKFDCMYVQYIQSENG